MGLCIKVSFSVLCVLGLVIVGDVAYAQDSPDDYVKAHNAARSQVGVPNLVWDNTVAAFAQNYTNQRKADCKLVHSVKLWVNEKSKYDYNSNSCVGGECRHYTQVVWKNSTRIGCAKVRCNNGGTFIAGYGAESDIDCLQTIKNLDSFNRLSSWDFETNAEGDICRFSGVECWHDVEDRVTSLWLSNMGLKGQFPRCVETFTWLRTLNLSHNELSGYIPSDISTMLPYLISLDLSNNNFFGEIPKGIADLSDLITLRLDGNQLSGQIPHELGLLPWLTDFSVANNLLEGPVPVFVSNVDVSLSYANNSGLCGGILGSCEESLFGISFWYSFIIGFISSATSVLVYFLYYYTPWTEFKKRSNAVHPLRNKENQQKDTGQEAELLPLALQEKGSKESMIQANVWCDISSTAIKTVGEIDF
ncbi:putative inactive leucine-rich repeat receptor-like protein kinase, partial [Mucuna pruriens]